MSNHTFPLIYFFFSIAKYAAHGQKKIKQEKKKNAATHSSLTRPPKVPVTEALPNTYQILFLVLHLASTAIPFITLKTGLSFLLITTATKLPLCPLELTHKTLPQN